MTDFRLDWIDGYDVAECCDVEIGSSSLAALDDAADAAMEILYALGGRQHSGVQGPVVVRPYSSCRHVNAFWAQNWGAWNTTVGIGWWNRLSYCRCEGPPTVTLAGFPIQEITEIKIDGETLPEIDPETSAPNWRLDHSRDLVRMRDPALPKRRRAWPARQILDLDDDQPNTWSVAYLYGQEAPEAARLAAIELACQLYKACSDGDGGTCDLPDNVVKVVRAGITTERALIGKELRDTGFMGLPECDLYLSAFNPNRITQRAAFWSPDIEPYPYRPGS